MTWGIGLGGFVDGVEAGIGIREAVDQRRERRSQRQRLAAIEDETRAAYNNRVASGQEQPDQYDDFWRKYALPRRQAELLKQGDIAGARALEEWGMSDAARRGGRLFASAMLKAQTGDHEGALNDAIQAARVKGYIEHDYELVSQDELKTEDGTTVGYRLTLRQGDKEIQQDIPVSDVPKIVSIYANPDNAWASQIEARRLKEEAQSEDRKDQTKRQRDLDDHRSRKEIDAEFDSPDHEDAYRKAFNERLENDLEFADLSPEEQDAVVRADLERQRAFAREQSSTRGAPGITRGAPKTPTGDAAAVTPKQRADRILIDTRSGQQVGPRPAEQTVQRRPQAVPQPDPSFGTGNAPAASAPAPGIGMASEQQSALDQARRAIASGADEQDVRNSLIEHGIDPSLLNRP